MPYADQVMGIYKIVNSVNGKAYVGQSQNIKKRVAEHFRLLRNGKHNNPRLQNAFNKYGEDSFVWTVEVWCEDVNDLDGIEEAFLSGEAHFVEPLFYNIADFSKAPMRGKAHSEEARRKISLACQKKVSRFSAPEYRQKLSSAQTKRYMSDPAYLKKVIFVISNPHLTYSERARIVGSDASTVRKLAIKYTPMKNQLLKECQ